MLKYKVGLISLGCDKNRIDSEIILGKFSKKYDIVNDAALADILIVNTCGFIEDAKQESIDTILEMAQYKKNNCKVLIATGCLTQRYGKELMELIPELDLIFGVNDYEKILSTVEKYLNENQKLCYYNYSDSNINTGERILTTGKSTAYLRIAEGCNNYCAYCIIPKIRGHYRSRPMEEVINEAKDLVKKGVKEIILVAQDTTRYGIDLYGSKKLHKLLKELSNIESIKWIRILYCYPEEITEELLDEIACNEKVCKYLDIPLQHVSNDVLKNMRRRSRKEEIVNVISTIRNKIPNVCLRTSIIVGFPGESDDNFKELKEFVKDIGFDKLGVFKYSKEEGTPAAEMENQVEESIKEKRQQELMIEQQKVSKEINNKKIGKIYNVLVEGYKDGYWYGRNYEMSPEIDGSIWFKCDKILKEGQFIKLKINKSLEYDLVGVVCDESC
ncbi:30S ribosomal protein S12 methylthiotransferase RimO [Haloimpatiens sp. FM7330]|uniref:30S ribosomal protein S12 methylthiotransferase RimO n=1 Tax=Haloimpatiens sp. FM7330 TaxID=3298610 RepID=UPI00363DDDA1